MFSKGFYSVSRGSLLAVAAAVGALAAVAAHAHAANAVFSDTFSRADTSAATWQSSPNPIGNGWVINTSLAGATTPNSTNPTTWQISGDTLSVNPQATFQMDTMTNPGALTPDTGGNNFSLSVDVSWSTIPTSGGNNDYAGLVFGCQSSGGSSAGWNILRMEPITTASYGSYVIAQTVSASSNFTDMTGSSRVQLSTPLSAGTFYQMSVSSTTPGNFNWSVSTTGSSPTTLGSGAVADGSYANGIGGLFTLLNDPVSFTNFSDTFTAVPAPDTLGLFAVGGAALVLIGRKRRACLPPSPRRSP